METPGSNGIDHENLCWIGGKKKSKEKIAAFVEYQRGIPQNKSAKPRKTYLQSLTQCNDIYIL